jgi:phosphotriesterase-related protein
MAVITVCGEVSGDRLGAVLTHEHLACDFSPRSGNPDNRMLDAELMIEELGHFRRSGGGALVEVTPCDAGSSPALLRSISAGSDVAIVHGIAFYQEDSYPEWVRSASEAEIAAFFVERIVRGHDGVRSGLIGELGSHNEDHSDFRAYRMRELESKVFRAAAQAQRATSVLISTHASLGRGGSAQLDLLESAGADPSRIVIGHCDTYGGADEGSDLEYYLSILGRGAYVQFDLIGWNSEWPGIATDALRARRVATLVRMGHAGRLLVASDTCRLSQLHVRGGRGYDHVLTSFVPRLRAEGVSDDDIRTILVENPRRALAVPD